MGIFNQRKPRGFQHQYIYVDERKERLREMEEQKEKLRPYLSPNDYEVAERVVEEARIKIAKKFSL